MVIPAKVKKEKATLAQLEAESAQEIEQVKCRQQEIWAEKLKIVNSAGFYFAVAFANQEERDAWCKSHGVVLTDGEYILAQDYTISMEKR